jgi:hypothetical protein
MSDTQLKSGSLCQFTNRDGGLCKRRIAEGETRCWQHARTIKHRWKSLTRNESVGFIIAVMALLFGLVFGGLEIYWHYSNQASSTTQSLPSPDKPSSQGHSDIELEFVGKEKLQFLYYANSDESANEPKRFFGLWDINRPFHYSQFGDVTQALQLTWKTDMDFVFRGTKQGPMDVLDVPGAANLVQKGDRLFGIAYVTCMNCETQRAYWVYFVVGSGGWYKQMTGLPWGKTIQIPKSDASEIQIQTTIDNQVSQNGRIPIPEKQR